MDSVEKEDDIMTTTLKNTAKTGSTFNMTIFKFALIKGLRSPGTFIFNCVIPIALILIRPLWTGDVFISGFGLLIMVIWGGAFLMSQGIINDRQEGALTRILSAPISMRNYLVQNLLAFMVPLSAQIVLVTVLGAVLYGWSLSLALLVFLCYTVFTISAVAMSFAWNCLFKSKDGAFSSFSVMVTFGTFLSGALIPIEAFPEGILQYIGAVLPAYWAVRALNTLSAAELTITAEYWTSILALALFTIAFLLYGGKRRLI